MDKSEIVIESTFYLYHEKQIVGQSPKAGAHCYQFNTMKEVLKMDKQHLETDGKRIYRGWIVKHENANCYSFRWNRLLLRRMGGPRSRDQTEFSFSAFRFAPSLSLSLSLCCWSWKRKKGKGKKKKERKKKKRKKKERESQSVSLSDRRAVQFQPRGQLLSTQQIQMQFLFQPLEAIYFQRYLYA